MTDEVGEVSIKVSVIESLLDLVRASIDQKDMEGMRLLAIVAEFRIQKILERYHDKIGNEVDQDDVKGSREGVAEDEPSDCP